MLLLLFVVVVVVVVDGFVAVDFVALADVDVDPVAEDVADAELADPQVVAAAVVVVVVVAATAGSCRMTEFPPARR